MNAPQSPVIIIGAGMAGLMAARTLRDAGRDVLLLEARDRIGGRTHTDYSLGVSVDLGAAWIHGPDGNPLKQLADRYGIRYGLTDFINRAGNVLQAYDADGTPLDMVEYTQGLMLANGAWIHAEASVLVDRPTAPPASYRTYLDHVLPVPADLTPTQRLGFHYWSTILMEYLEASDAEQIDMALDRRHRGLPGGDLLLYGGGFSALLEPLADGLPIETGAVVQRIVRHADGVLVSTGRGDYAGSAVILTVPLGVLQSGSITFDPPLTRDKQAAIARVGHGHYEKLAMRFDRFYWPHNKQRFNYLSVGEPSLFNVWLNAGYYHGQPVIVAYHAGRRARAVNGWSDDEYVARAVAVMQRIFGDNGFGTIPQPQATLRTNWENDPFAYGSYSFDRVGQVPGDRRRLARPEGDRLFFAGEATHPFYFATVHGAYETGVRAARELLAAEAARARG